MTERRFTIGRRRRRFKILRLFFALLFSFLFQYGRARLLGRRYDFFTDSKHNRGRAIRLRKAALDLGGVLIKVGQFLSSRVDLLPSEYIEELALLQDEVPGVPFAAILHVIESELGASQSQIFSELDPLPVAAASLGQVHRARLRTGQVVAVKVQRPHIDQIVEADLQNLRLIIGWLDRFAAIRRRANLRDILAEFESTLRLELDYVQEGHHAERLAVMFGDSPDIAVPRVYWSYTTTRVITLQFMTGTKVTDFPALEDAGISRTAVAETLMRAYLYQVLTDGFFHADPHPGNILVRPGPVIVLLDFGMVGEILPATRSNLRRVFLGVIRRDFDEVLDALGSLGFITRNADRRALKRALSWTVDNFYGLSFGELQAVNPQYVIDELQDVIFSEGIQIPSNYAFLGRALGTLSGLCTALDPGFQFVTVAEPFGRRLIREEIRLSSTLRELGREARELGRVTYGLPFLSRKVLENFESGEMDLRRDITDVVNAVERVERALRRAVFALFVLGFLVAAALLARTHYDLLAAICAASSVLFLALALRPVRRISVHRRP